MAKKIKYTDIADGKPLQPLIDQGNELVEVLDKMSDGFKEVIKEAKKAADNPSFKSTADIKATQEAINKVTEATVGLDNIEKQRLKLQQRLKEANDERSQSNAVLSEQIKQRNKELREAAKTQAGLLDAYQLESKRLNDLRKQYKNLAVAGKANTKESKELLKVIQKLDKELKEIDESVGQAQRSVGFYSRALEGLEGKLISVNIASSVASKAFDGLKGAVSSNGETAAALDKITGSVSLAFSAATASTIDFAKALIDGKGVTDAFNDSFEGITEKVVKATEANNKAVDATRANAKAVAELEIQAANLTRTQQDLQVVADDSTLSLQDQLLATKQLIIANQLLADKQTEIAQKRLQGLELTAKAEKIAGNVTIETIQAVSEARVALIDAETQQAQVRADNARTQREILRDLAELELDILIDAFDNQKTINERIIANDKVALDARKDLLKETTRLADESARAQIEVIEELTGKTIDANDLIQESDTITLNNKIKALELDEIIQIRLLEVIRDRRTAVQDLKETEEDLTETQQDASDISKDIIIQQETLLALNEKEVKLTEVLTDLENKREKQNIQNLRDRLALAKEGSTERLELQQELNDALIDQQTKAGDNSKDKQKEIQDAALESTKNFVDKQSAIRLNAIDKEIAASENRIDTLKKLASEGAEDATENLATEQRKAAELERKREQELKQKARRELVVSAIETYSAKVEAGDKNALASTVTDIGLLTQIINGLPLFFEGTENVSKSLGAPDLAGKDGHIIRVDGSERILSGAQNAMIGGMGNMELATLARNHQRGEFEVGANSDFSGVMSALNDVKQSIDNKPVYMGTDFDPYLKMLEIKVMQKGRVQINRIKPKGL